MPVEAHGLAFARRTEECFALRSAAAIGWLGGKNASHEPTPTGGVARATELAASTADGFGDGVKRHRSDKSQCGLRATINMWSHLFSWIKYGSKLECGADTVLLGMSVTSLSTLRRARDACWGIVSQQKRQIKQVISNRIGSIILDVFI
jgi:hypothetical protein